MNYQIVWVKKGKYCELSGDTSDAIHCRRRKGRWVDGLHCKLVDGNLWINLKEVEKWVIECGTTAAKAARG